MNHDHQWARGTALPLAVRLMGCCCLVGPLVARDVITPDLRAAMGAAGPGERVSACCVMADQIQGPELAQEVRGLRGRVRRAAVAKLLIAHAAKSQGAVRETLASERAAGRAGNTFVLWMGNAVLFCAEPAVIYELGALAGVDRIESTPASPAEAEEDAQPAMPAVAGNYPFHEDFESGALSAAWSVLTTGAAEVKVTSANGPVGNYQCEMDSAIDNVDGTASITVSLDLTGQSDVGIRFEHKEFSDEDNLEDGVFVSDDGVTWIEAQSLNGDSILYKLHYIELDPIATAAGLTYGPGFRVRFQWRDNFSIPTDGFAFDDIDIAKGVGSPALPPPEPNLIALQAPQLWALGHNGAGVMVGTIDTGVWITHPDLVHRIWNNPGEIPNNGLDDDGDGFVDDLHGWDFVNNGPNVMSGLPHGTLTAGIVCGDGSSGGKLTGMAPGTTLVCLKADSEADYWASEQYCLQVGVDCITSSLSYKWDFAPKPDYSMHRQLCAVELAADIAHANSIGDSGQQLSIDPLPFNISTPGDCPSPFDHPALAIGGRGSVIAVGGIELPSDTAYAGTGKGPVAWEDMKVYDPQYPWAQNASDWDYPYGGFSGGLPGLIKPDVVAYTTNIQTTDIGTGYATLGGTSAATPHVGGALALLLSTQPQAEPRHLDAALELTAVDLGDPGKDNIYGAGKIQVYDGARRLVVLGRVDDQTPPVGGSFTLDLFAPANASVAWLTSLSISDTHTDFNLDVPFYLLGVLPVGPTGHIAVPVPVPAMPALSGVQIWSQFTTKGVAPEWGPKRLWSVPEDITPQ